MTLVFEHIYSTEGGRQSYGVKIQLWNNIFFLCDNLPKLSHFTKLQTQNTFKKKNPKQKKKKDT